MNDRTNMSDDKALHERLCWSITELAKVLGCSRPEVYNLEKDGLVIRDLGKRMPRVFRSDLLAFALSKPARLAGILPVQEVAECDALMRELRERAIAGERLATEAGEIPAVLEPLVGNVIHQRLVMVGKNQSLDPFSGRFYAQARDADRARPLGAREWWLRRIPATGTPISDIELRRTAAQLTAEEIKRGRDPRRISELPAGRRASTDVASDFTDDWESRVSKEGRESEDEKKASWIWPKL